jgi:hypothetical protein
MKLAIKEGFYMIYGSTAAILAIIIKKLKP